MNNKKNYPERDSEFYIYPYSLEHAVAVGELEQYCLSRSRNKSCVAAIDAAIRMNYDFDSSLLKKGIELPLIEKYGYDRICWVLAYFVKYHLYDGRISNEAKTWAKAFKIPEEGYIREYSMSGHVGLVDIFIKRILDFKTEM